jgi:hypothetical protein
MVFDNRRTYICYNNKDLIRDGFIRRSIIKSYREDNSLTNPVTTFNFNRLRNPPKGVTYEIIRKGDPSIIVEVREKKKLLPAEKIKIEFNFSKTTKSAVTHPIGPSSIAHPLANTLSFGGLGAIGFGGFSSGLTEMTYHIIESKTKINQKVVVTQEILDTSIIQLDGFPLSVFGIVREHVEEFEDDPTTDTDPKTAREKAVEYKADHPQAKIGTNSTGGIVARIGLNFTSDQLEFLGRFSQGSFLGTGVKRISGATDSNGLFGGAASPYLVLVDSAGDSDLETAEAEKREVIFLGDQEQLFIKIVEDDRTLKFRGDNKEAEGGGRYPFEISGTTGIDATDKQIRIDTTDLIVEDILYVTHNTTVGDRHLRQNVEHKGTIGQGNTVGIVGFTGAVQSEQDIYDYKLREWKVPPLPDGISMPTIDHVTDDYTQDDDYKLTLDDFLDIDAKEREEEDFELDESEASKIEGWRLSEAIIWRRVKDLFAADFRGILHIKNRSTVTILYPRASIRDQDWFTEYLESLPFTDPTGPPDPDDPVDDDGNPKPTYLPSDLEKTLESQTNFADLEGFLFDTSEIANSLLFDREKLHYYRPFAEALKIVSKYKVSDPDSGIGINNLDLLPMLCSSIVTTSTTEFIDGETITRREYNYTGYDSTTCDVLDLEYYDLSYGVFDNVSIVGNKTRSCEDSFPARKFDYFSTNRDANGEGQGIFYGQGFLDSIGGWRPPGGIMQSHWKLETPYFCGNFNSSTRIYVEKMGGNSLDSYSWIYVDTESFLPSNISVDSNYDSMTSTITFSDDIMHNGLSYHRINDNFFERQLSSKKIDKTKNHIRDTYEHTIDGQTVTEAYDHDQNFMVGQNRMLGDSPSFSHGIPVTDEVLKIPFDPDLEDFWFTKDLLNDTWDDGTSFDLSFSDSPPRANIPFNWYVKNIEIEFSYAGDVEISNIEKYVSFYFEDSESSLSDFLVTESTPKGGNFVFGFNMKYYFGGPIQFLGDFWDLASISDVKATFAFGGDQNVEDKYNIDTYKITTGQSAVSYDRQGRILIFYANEETDNIDIAISYDDGATWAYDRNIIRLTSSEIATMPFVVKDTNSRFVHLFWVLNDKFLMYRQVDPDRIDVENGSVKPIIPETYEAGDYDLTLDDPERAYWGDFTFNGILLRREPSYFVVGSADDEYFLDYIETLKGIVASNDLLVGTSNRDKIQTQRFFPASDPSEMRNDFNGSPYVVHLADDGVLRLFFVSNNRLSIKSSYNYISWKYDIVEQSIHKNYMDEELNRGFSEDISNVQIVRNDYDKSLISILYMNNEMLFIRHFHTNVFFPWTDEEGNSHDDQIVRSLEVTDEDLTADPPKNRTSNVPIFLVGVIPEKIRDSIKDDIENDISTENSDLAIYFPYRDPDDHSGLTDDEIKDLNKSMVDIFNVGTKVTMRVINSAGTLVDKVVDTNFEIDTSTQPYSFFTGKGLIRVFYKDNFGNIDGIIIDSLNNPNLEVMNVFNGVDSG